MILRRAVIFMAVIFSTFILLSRSDIFFIIFSLRNSIRAAVAFLLMEAVYLLKDLGVCTLTRAKWAILLLNDAALTIVVKVQFNIILTQWAGLVPTILRFFLLRTEISCIKVTFLEGDKSFVIVWVTNATRYGGWSPSMIWGWRRISFSNFRLRSNDISLWVF